MDVLGGLLGGLDPVQPLVKKNTNFVAPPAFGLNIFKILGNNAQSFVFYAGLRNAKRNLFVTQKWQMPLPPIRYSVHFRTASQNISMQCFLLWVPPEYF